MEKLEYDNKIIKENCIKKTKIGINSDITGYGKTLTMIGLISRDKMEWDLELPYTFETIISEGKGRVRNYFTSRYDKLPTTLILVSNSIVGQWEKEIQKSTLNYFVVKSCKDIEKVKAEEYDVILITVTYFNKIAMMYSKFAWKRFIFDEPGHLKVAGMREIHAGFYWLVTATPELILNQHKFCKGSFMKDILTGMHSLTFLDDITIQNSPEFIRSSFEMPNTNYIVHNCFQPLYNVIEKYVSSSIRNMVEAGDIEGAIESLGGTKTSNIVELIREKKSEEIEEINMKICLYAMREDDIKLNKWLGRKERIENQLTEINEKYENMLKTECNICTEVLTEPVLEPQCQNLFCGRCLFQWLMHKNTCPLCRCEINPKELIYVSTATGENSKELKGKIKEMKMTKVEKIIDIISSKPEGKFLVFSDYDNTFYPICSAMRENRIHYVQVKGNVKTREKNLDSFRNGDTKVIFLNSTTDGSGINLTESTDIILCHGMDESSERQIIGRALRVGRKEPLNVHYLQIMK